MKSVTLLAVLLVLVLCAGCAREHEVDYQMIWREGSQPGHVYFDFKEFPNHYVDIVSVELRDYLAGLGTNEVTMRFEVETWLGCVESIRGVRIEDRTDWRRRWAYSGWVESKDPSPWDRFKCRLPWWED